MFTRTFAAIITTVTVVAFLVSAPAAIASAPHTAKPSSVSLTSGYASVKSSTKRALHAQLEASNNPSTPANDSASIELAKGAQEDGESHDWTFRISSSVLQVASSGAGTLKLPAKDIAPFGAVSLKFKPIGKPKTKSCEGTVISKTIKVSLSGVFFFDSKSTGSHKWGTVGSKKSFTFPATNTITWLFRSANSENCISAATPCVSDVLWSSQQGAVAFDGFEASNDARMFASRSALLTKPTGATRSDSNVGSTKGLTVAVGGDGNASLAITGSGSGVAGSATITSSAPSQPFPSPCGNGKTQNSEFWSGPYANGTAPLTVAEQIYGALTMGDNGNGSIGQTTVS